MAVAVQKFETLKKNQRYFKKIGMGGCNVVVQCKVTYDLRQEVRSKHEIRG